MLLLLPGECDPGRIPGIAAALPRPGRVTAPRCQPGLLSIPGDNPSIPSGFPQELPPVLPAAWEDLQDFRIYISLYKTQTVQTKLFLHQKVPANSRLEETSDQAGGDFPPCSQLQAAAVSPPSSECFLQLALFF